jgi:DNA-directed RNA polymerase specialized sigma24 family protein
MSWASLPPDIRTTAERVCTDKELVALKLWHNGAGYRRIGLILGISMSTARGRVHRALDRIANTTEKEQNEHRPDPVREPHRPIPESTP